MAPLFLDFFFLVHIAQLMKTTVTFLYVVWTISISQNRHLHGWHCYSPFPLKTAWPLFPCLKVSVCFTQLRYPTFPLGSCDLHSFYGTTAEQRLPLRERNSSGLVRYTILLPFCVSEHTWDCLHSEVYEAASTQYREGSLHKNLRHKDTKLDLEASHRTCCQRAPGETVNTTSAVGHPFLP